jgi:Leucine-rich repeat (LRR) protein
MLHRLYFNDKFLSRSNLTLSNMYLSVCWWIENFPLELGRLSRLTCFKVTRIKVDALQILFKSCTQLKVLEISKLKNKHNCQYLPSELWTLKNLKDFSLKSNIPFIVPPQISCLCKLEELDLSDNRLISLSHEFSKLTKLKVIDLSDNRLTRFNVNISSFTRLYSFDLNNNRLRSIPTQLSPTISFLYLQSNQIASIPHKPLARWTKLVILDLSMNQITILPTEIGLLTSLQSLDLSSNRLSFVPSDLVRNCPSLPFLSFSNFLELLLMVRCLYLSILFMVESIFF